MNSEPSRHGIDADWLAEAKRSLRGQDPADLATRTRDGIEIQPLYTQATDRPAALSALIAPTLSSTAGAVSRWDIRQRHTVSADSRDSEQAIQAMQAIEEAIAEDLANGVTSLELQILGDHAADALTKRLGTLLKDVDLAKTPLALAPHSSISAAEALLAAVNHNDSSLAAGSSLGLDPLGEAASSGEPSNGQPSEQQSGQQSDLQGVAAWAMQQLKQDNARTAARILLVDAVRYSDAGATEAQVLGWATATGVAYLRALVDQGATVEQAAGLIGFRFAATADQFMSIAALRAARVLWHRVVTVSAGSVEVSRQYQHAVTAAHIFSRWDRWVNLLRGSSATLASAVAGVDAITVLPFDVLTSDVLTSGQASPVVTPATALGRRLARNTQLLIMEESHLAWTSDPAGGSFYVELLTRQLAQQGWRVLQDVESSGGIEAAIASGELANSAKQSWLARLEALRNRSERLTGVSDFVSLSEPAPADCAASTSKYSEHDSADPLPVRYLAEPFEELRDAAHRYQLEHGARPTVQIVALGLDAPNSPRCVWAQNLLAVAGIKPRITDGFDSPVAAAADFAESGLQAAVIVGSDEIYQLRAAATVAALKDSGASFVVLVCDPSTSDELITEVSQAGDGNIAIWREGIDAVAMLERLHRSLGVM